MKITLKKETAENLTKAVNFLIIACTKSPDHVEIDEDSMNVLNMTIGGLSDLIDLKEKLKKMIAREERTLRDVQGGKDSILITKK